MVQKIKSRRRTPVRRSRKQKQSDKGTEGKTGRIYCERQLNSLYTRLGELLYNNIKDGKINYHFETEELEKQAANLLPTTQKPEISSAKKTIETKPINRRGLIEPYTKLRIKLYEAEKKLLIVKETIDEYLSLAMLHLEEASSKQTESYFSNLKEVEDKMMVLIKESSEVVREIMGKKKDLIESSKDSEIVQFSELEKEFLKKISSDIENMARNVDTLTQEAKELFRDIKYSYEKDLESHRQLQAERKRAEKIGEEEEPKIKKKQKKQ